MTLSDWAAQHRDEIIAEDASRAAVTPLLAVIGREITDAEGVPSDDGRLEHALAACLAAALAALAACGAQALLDGAARIRPEIAASAAALLLVPAALAWTNAEGVSARSARCYADATLAVIAPGAIVMSWWSYATPLWYARYVDGARPDVEVVLGDRSIAAELDRRFPDGRPIYLVQRQAQLDEIRQRYVLEPVAACGETLQRVVRPRAEAEASRQETAPTLAWARRATPGALP